MALDLPPQAQPGDETMRQVTPDIGALLQNQLSLAESFQQQAQSRFQNVKQLAGTTGVQSVGAMRDLSQRVPGQAPSEMIGSANKLANTVLSGVESAGQQFTESNKNIMSLLGLMQDQESKNIELGLKKAELYGKGYKLDGADLVPLTAKEKESAGLVAEDAVAEVVKQGGRDLIKGGSAGERKAIAEEILRTGGVKEYRKLLPLKDLLTTKELDAVDSQTDLDILLEQAINTFENTKTMTGTGPLAALIPGVVAGEKTRELRRNVENIKAQYARAISGAVISDREMKRLSTFLPSASKTEAQNLEDMRKLQNDIKINQEIFELGKREGLTPNEAFAKYGEQVFAQYGQSSAKRPPLDSFVKGTK